MKKPSLKEVLNQKDFNVKPRAAFAWKMRMRLYGRMFKDALTGPNMVLRYAGLATILFFTLGGTVGTYAYSSADVNENHVLYPVKTGLEEFEGWFKFTEEQKAEHFMYRAQRRMDEIARMEEKLGNLNLNERANKAATKALDKMEKHMNRALEVAQNGEFETEPALKFLNKFEQKMKHVHEKLDGVSSMNERMFNAKLKIERRISNLRQVRQKIEMAPHENHMRVPLRNFFERQNTEEVFLPLRFSYI
ncbi:hypothetical protein GF340_06245 [Candidatus Peregrinibacteria bacterium]|nr:hypothetical protein [Candidatus Peregrinibacteria bacterium]